MSTSHGSLLPGMSRSETQNPHRPALGVEPLPTAPSSYVDLVSNRQFCSVVHKDRESRLRMETLVSDIQERSRESKRWFEKIMKGKCIL